MMLSWFQLGYWKSTESLFQHAVDVSPSSAAAQNGLGTAFLERGNFEGAARHLKFATMLAPTFPVAHYNLGLALGSLNRIDKAISSFSRALTIEPDYPEAHYTLVVMLYRIGKPHEAEAHCREAVRLSSSYLWGTPSGAGEISARLLLGDLLIEAKRWEDAAAEFRGILGRFPNNGEAYYGLARNGMMQGKPEDAKKNFEKAIELMPESMEVQVNFANFLEAQDDLDAAIRLYQRALKINPANADFNYFLAGAFVRQKKLKEAKDSFEAALKVMPHHVAALRDYSWLLATTSDTAIYNPGEAVRLARPACEAGGRSDATCLDALAAALSEAGSFSDASKTAEEVASVAKAQGISRWRLKLKCV
jgi:tetratricopeptide (TPR) repeat protein